MNLESILEYSAFKMDNSLKITIGGAPRSGSTYLAYILDRQYNISGLPIIKTHMESHHLARAIAPDPKENWIIPVRNPEDTAKSFLVWHYHKDSVEKVQNNHGDTTAAYGILDTLARLWETILLNKKNFIIVDFNDIVSDRIKLESYLENLIPTLKERKFSSLVSDEEIQKKLIDDSRTDLKTELNYLNLGNFPRQRTELYLSVSREFDSKRYTKRFLYLEELKKELLSF